MNNQSENIPNKKRRVVRIILVILALIFCGFVGYIMVRFAMNKEYFQGWMEEHGILGRFAYCLMVIFQVVVALVPGEPLEIAGGYAFGVWQGTILYLLSATIGGMLVFLLVRKYGTNLVETIFSKEDVKGLGFLKATRKIDRKKKEALLIVLFILPGTPKDLICYFAGLTTISTKLWFVVCSLGRLPSLLTSTLGGEALETENYKVAIIAFVIALLISLGGLLLYKKIHQKNNDKEKEKNETVE